MRRERLFFILLVFYVVLLGGSGYYYQLLPIRALHHGIMTLLLAGWLLRRIRNNRGLPPTPLNLALMLLVAVWFFSAIFSGDVRLSIENLWFPITHLLIFFVIVDLLQRGRQRLIFETVFLVAATVVLISGLQIVSVFFGLGIGRAAGQGWINFLSAGIPLPLDDLRIWLPLGVSTWVAGFVAPLIPISAAWAMTVRQRDQRMVLLGLSIGLGIVLLLTFSRGGLLSILVSSAVFIFLRFAGSLRGKALLSKQIVPLAGVGLTAAGAVAILVLSIGAIPGRQSGDQVRVDLWRSAALMVRDDPLTGVGPGLYGSALREYRTPELARDRLSSAHNAYLNAAAETGLFTLLVGGWLLVIIVRTWYTAWQTLPAHYGRRIRLEGMFAALIGFGVHSLFDTFTITTNILVLCVIVAYCIVTPAKSRLAEVPSGQRRGAGAALTVVVAFGVWFVSLDLAQARFQNSLSGGEAALAEARAAAALDPGLRLYELQIVYLQGQSAFENPEQLAAAITGYEQALAIVPTWDTGWINLAGLYEQQGDLEQALTALEQARAISPFNSASFHWARIAEVRGDLPNEEVKAAYQSALRVMPYPPYSSYWQETELRRTALNEYIALTPATTELDYRIMTQHFSTEALMTVVPAQPVTASDWWIVGEHALTVEADAARAVAAFDEAIRLNRSSGDYYASRARALSSTNPAAARRDLDIARFLGTRFEFPNAIEIQIAPDDQRQRLQATALPPRIQSQEFEGVSFAGRRASFDPLPTMRFPGPGEALLQPYYDLAANYERMGDLDTAAVVYRYILDLAPESLRARDALTRLDR